MDTKVLPADEPELIAHAADTLRHGGVVAFPTDTVYGLAAALDLEDAIERLYTIKGREHDKAIAVLLADAEQLPRVADKPDPLAMALARAFWPGPLTLVVPRHPGLPKNLSPLPTVGVRVPDHPLALALLRETGPLAVTSANLSREPNTSTAGEVLQQLQGRVHLVIDGGRTPGGLPSTVVDTIDGAINVLREGPITKKMLMDVVIG
jgi:L-threonylcarbamoyladenylate synthase